jgi:hypothetical protein
MRRKDFVETTLWVDIVLASSLFSGVYVCAMQIPLRPALEQPRREHRIVIRKSDRLWQVSDETRDRGGFFVTLAAALAFARSGVDKAASGNLVIVGT